MSDANTLTFEEAYQLLQETVERLEDGALPLAEAVGLYEQGMRLTAICAAHLDQAELRVARIDEVLAELLNASEVGADQDENGLDEDWDAE